MMTSKSCPNANVQLSRKISSVDFIARLKNRRGEMSILNWLRLPRSAAEIGACDCGGDDGHGEECCVWLGHRNAARGDRVADNTERGPGGVAVVVFADAIQILVEAVRLSGGSDDVGEGRVLIDRDAFGSQLRDYVRKRHRESK